MSGGYQYTDNRNGFQPGHEYPYYQQMTPMQYYGSAINYAYQIMPGAQPQFTQQMFSAVQPPPVQHPASAEFYRQPYNQPMPVPQNQPLPPPQSYAPAAAATGTTKRKGLSIVNPDTKEEIDLSGFTTKPSASASEARKPHTPLKVETPPAKLVKPTEGASVAAAPTETVLTTQESSPADKLMPDPQAIDDDTKGSSKELQHSEHSQEDASPQASEVEEAEENEEECNKDEADEDAEIEEESPAEETQSDEEASEASGEESGTAESDTTGRIRKYNRDQLIAIRSATDFSALIPPPNMLQSAVSVHGGHNRKLRPENRHHNSKRVLNFAVADVKLDDVENAYKPAYLKQNGGEDTDRKQQLTKDLNILFNRVLEDNIPEIVDEVKKLSVKDSQEIACLVKVLTTKATRQTKYSEVFAKLCVGLSSVKQLDGFKPQLLRAVQELFRTPLQTHIDQLNTQIDAKIKEATDEKVKKMLEEDRETAISKKREAFLGIMQFFSQLYINKQITDKSLCESLRPYSRPKTQDDILALLTCLNTCGQMMDQKSVNVLKDCIAGLEAAKRDVKMEQYVLYKITALLELRARGWKKLEPVPPPPPQVLPRSNSSGVNLARRIQTHNVGQRKMGDSQTLINARSLTVSNQSSRASYLGPASDWSQGSKAQLRQPKSETASESENGKESRASSVSTKKRGQNQAKQQPSTVKVDETMTANEAIRDAIDAFTNSDAPEFDLTLREKEKNEFVKESISRALDTKADARRIIVNFLAHVYKKQQVSDAHMEKGFTDCAELIDDLDCPKFAEFYGEILSCLLTPATHSLERIFRLLENLPSEKEKLDGLAQCLKTASKRIGEPEVAAIYQKAAASAMPWNTEAVFKEPDFVKRFHLEFLSVTAPKQPSAPSGKQQRSQQKPQQPTPEPTLAERMHECLQQKDLNELSAICSKLPHKHNDDVYFKVIFGFNQKPVRKEVDSLMPTVKIILESSPNLEKNMLFDLQNSVSKEAFKIWLPALLQRKVISKQTAENYAMSRMSKTEYKDVAQQVLRNRR